MNKTNQILLSILLIVIFVGIGYFYINIKNAIPTIPTIPSLPTANLSTPTQSPDVVDTSATQLGEAGHPIPTQVINFWREDNLMGLLNWYTAQDSNWSSISTNIHTNETSGVAESSETVYNNACFSPWPLNKLCKSATIKWGAVYRGRIIGGINSISTPVFTLKGDWSDVRQTTTETQIDVYSQSTAIITYDFIMCTTAVEAKDPTLVHTGEEKPDDTSYWILLQDDRLLPDVWEYRQELPVNEEALRINAMAKAKTIALLPEKIKTVYTFVRSDIEPGGEFYKKLTSPFTAEVANMFKVKGFEFVINITEGDPLVRCDGTPVNK